MTCGLEAGTKWSHMWVGSVHAEGKNKGVCRREGTDTLRLWEELKFKRGQVERRS